MKLFLLTALLLISVSSLYAQVVISGRVTDEKSNPLAYAGVALLNAADSSFVRGALSNEKGDFIIENIIPGNYLLQGSLLGHEKKYTEPFSVEASNQKVSVELSLPVSGVMIQETEITASRPLFEQRPDRLVMNIANSPVSSGGSALEMLQKMPGIIVIQDRVTLAGNQNIQIWIDGRPSQYADMSAVLRDMPGDQIDRIELITQPGAQFDAAGGAIINIILKRNAELGFTATASMTAGGSWYDQTEIGSDDNWYHRLNPSLNMNYRNGKVNLFGSYSYFTRSNFDVQLFDRFIALERYDQTNYDPASFNGHNFRAGADFFLSEKSTLGILARGFSREGDNRARSISQVFSQIDHSFLGEFTTLNNATSSRQNYAGNINFKQEFNPKTGHALNVDLNYIFYNIDRNSKLNIFQNDDVANTSFSQQKVAQPIDILVGQIDYILPIDSTFKLETGIKSSLAYIDNDLQFFRETQLDSVLSNVFLYKENVNAAYFNLSKKAGRFDLSAGLRTEQTVVNGESRGNKVLDRNYWQLFPSGSALYHVNEHFGIQSSYSLRVNRPNFQQQNPFVEFIDSLTYTQGNPALLPETSHNAQLAVTYDNQPFIRISYSRTDDVIVENAPRIEGTRTFTTAENLAQNERWAFEVNFPIKIGKIIDGFGGNQFIRNAYNAEYLGTKFNQAKWNWLAYFQVNANLPAGLKLELNGWYITRFLNEFFTIEPLGSIDAGISKSFWNDRARISLSANDIFYTEKSHVTVDFADIIVDFREREDSRNFRLTFSYQFGNTKVKSSRRRELGVESETSRVKVE